MESDTNYGYGVKSIFAQVSTLKMKFYSIKIKRLIRVAVYHVGRSRFHTSRDGRRNDMFDRDYRRLVGQHDGIQKRDDIPDEGRGIVVGSVFFFFFTDD